MSLLNFSSYSIPLLMSHPTTIISITAPLLFFTILLFLLYVFYRKPASRKVFLVDFACYKPPAALKCTKEKAMQQLSLFQIIPQQAIDFQRKILEKSGLGESTYLSEALLKEPPNSCLEGARREAEMAVFGAIDELLSKTGVKCEDIGILVVNCSAFNVVPSLTSMVVNRYKLRDGITCYNLTGMACSAGLLAIGLANQLLQVRRDSYALVVSTENVTQNVYRGSDRSKLLGNVLFRLGGAAILLSSRPSCRHSAKYQLIHTVFTHAGSCDQSYNCIFQEEDQDGRVGITISKDLLASAIIDIRSNMTTLAPLVLPLSEQLLFLKNYISNRLGLQMATIRSYTPNFSKGIEHFLPHVGGKLVLDALQRSLGLSNTQMEASRMTLYRFGNTASSSVWYELAYVEAKGRMRRGDRVWQIAFGSGFMCNSSVWRAMRNVGCEEINPWKDEIDFFPVKLD